MPSPPIRSARPGAPPRVASLLPAATEIVCALGAGEWLAGRSHECDFPPEVARVPVLTKSKVLARGSSAGIDRDVREVLRSALAVYDIELDELRRADPDVIVTQDLCDVCAVSLDDVRKAAAAVLGERARIVNLRPLRLSDIFDDIARTAEALDLVERGASLIAQMHARIRDLARRAAAAATRPRVLTIEWIDPVMIGGTWMPELVELAGGTALVTKPGDHAPTSTRDQLAALDPEVVLIKPCGFELARSREELATIRDLLAAMPWTAVRANAVYLADGNAYFNRPGPRIVESLEILAACVHPSEFADLAKRHERSFERV
jgi:iron complex transport system substrate-binding protein